MYRIGREEPDRLAEVFRSKRLFRYMADAEGECLRFEKKYARRLGVAHCFMHENAERIFERWL